MPPIRRYHWNTPEYADAFATLLRASGERVHIHHFLRELLAGYPREARAIDWGAGSGNLTAVLLEHCRHVCAVEPSPEMRAVLARNCPNAQVIAGTITSVVPPYAADVGVISHVFYHIPDHKWGGHVIRAANHLSHAGVLLVILKDPDTASNDMLEHFGAPRFNLVGSLEGVIRRHREFDFTWTRRHGTFRTTSFEDTLKIARFMLCDRDEDAFSRLATEEEFQEYVRAHLWDEKAGTGGLPDHTICCLVRRNTSPER